MTTAMKCRRCSECAGLEHHWIDDTLSEESHWPYYVCKHCDAIGQECPRSDIDGGRASRRLRHEGAGIVVATMFAVTRDDDSPILVAASSAAEAADAYATMFGGYVSPSWAKPTEAVGRCEDCNRQVYEAEDYRTDIDGDGKWCSECAADIEADD